MKNCPECGKPVSLQLMYCGICGASLGQPVKSKRERLLFFITPIFLVLICVAFSIELGVADPVDSGLAFAGSFVLLFLGAACAFGVTAWLFKMPVLPESYWLAGLFAVIQFLACCFLAYSIEVLMLGEVVKNLGPLQYLQARAEILAVIFLPAFFAGLLAVSARARVTRFPESVKNLSARFLFKNALILIPVITLLSGVIMFMLLPGAVQGLIKARIAYDLDATEKSLKLFDQALKNHEEYAPLHFYKGMAIIDSQLPDYQAAEARIHLEKAVAKEPGVPLYLFRLSMAFDLEGKGTEAIATASEAANLLPGDAYLWQHLGDLNLKYLQFPAAVNAFKAALKYNMDDPVLLNNLAYTLLELDQELPQALEMARTSVEKIPEMVFNLDTLAWAYFKNGKHGEALEVMNSIFQGRSEVTPEVDFHYAMVLNALGMLKTPLQAFDAMLARPEVAADHKLFEHILAARNQVELSLDIKIGSDTPEIQLVGESANEK